MLIMWIKNAVFFHKNVWKRNSRENFQFCKEFMEIHGGLFGIERYGFLKGILHGF